MDIYQALEVENTHIRKVLGQLLDSTAAETGEREDFLEELRARLLAEKEVEESFIYPIILEQESTRSEARKLMDEQAGILRLVEEMISVGRKDAGYRLRIEGLYSEICEHLERQEANLFELARRVIPARQADELGIRVKEGLARVRPKYLH